jgi:SAM-dependent methyltransferase
MNSDPRADREDWLEGVRRTYSRYEAAGGRSTRWQGRERGMNLAELERDEWVASALVPAAGGNVVDLGCGDGNLARTLDRHAIRPGSYLGIDLIDARVTAARVATPWARFEVASADDCPVPDGWADAVVAMTLFSSIVERRFRAAVAGEMRRITRSGGRVVIYDMRLPSPHNPNVARLTKADLVELFPGWMAEFASLTLLPPLARTPIGGGALRYRALRMVPILRSHLGAILMKP